MKCIHFFIFAFFCHSIQAQNVGIGIANPVAKLDILGNGTTSATAALRVQNNAGSALLFANDMGNVGIGLSTGFMSSTRLHVMNIDQGLATPISVLESHNCGGNCGQTEGSTLALVNNNPNGAYMGSLTFAESGAYDVPSSGIFGTDRNVALRRAGLAFFTRNGTNYAERMRLDQLGRLGIGLTNPDDQLDVVGTAQISSYLKVGNPTAPSGSIDFVELYSWAGNSLTFSQYTCGNNNWVIMIGTNTYLYYDNPGSRSRHRVMGTWFWVPSNASNFQLHFVMESNLENTFDGTYAEIANSDNPNTYYKVNSFYQVPYNNNAVGSNIGCNANNTQAAWTGGLGFQNPRSNSMPIPVYGKWVKVALTGMSDASNGSGSASVYTIGAYCSLNNPLTTFNAGNIYAEKNVYAGRNVLFGDLAEYFKVNEPSEVGDVIALMPTNGDSYCVSKQKENPLLIGVYSTAPTLTLNNPDGGIPVALAGRVPVKVCNENGPIQIGDFLTSASRPGYAMKATNNCYVLGKAIENFSEKEGKIQCIVQTGWHNTQEVGHIQSSGTFYIPKGKSKITIQDENVLAQSRIFVSLLGNSGTTHWIGRKEFGAFEICFGTPLLEDLTFDYLVDNAANYSPKQDENGIETENKQAVGDIIIEKRRELLEEDDFVPPIPPNPTQFYQLDEHHNLIEYTPKIKTIPNVITKEAFFSSQK